MKGLKNLSALMRPAPFWSWNDKLDEAELRRQICEMAEKGWGSYFMHSRVGLVTGYLSQEWMDLINACADEAEKTGTHAWLYDEDKWPSGFAGGEVPKKDKRYRSRALVLLKKGTKTEDDTVLTSITYGGVDYEICCRVSPLGDSWFNGACYVDLMSPEAVREFINCTHERYKKSCGKHFGKAIPGIFTDEPCYLGYWRYNLPVVPWSDFLPTFFKELNGYDIREKLPLLFFDMDGYQRVRFDFYDAATELFKKNFTKQYYEWCEKNNLIMTGHFMAEDTLFSQTMWSGDVMSHYEFMHWPGIDKLGRTIQEIVTVKQVSSATDQLGKKRAFCEVFGCAGGQVSFFHRKWIGDWQAALGINFVNHHLSLYSMRGERKRDFPANLFYQQPWWKDERGLADYQARLCTAISEGERMVEVLVIQPLTSVWCEYSPLHRESEFANEKVYDEPFAKISRKLMEEKLDFHYGNENLLAKYGSVKSGKVTGAKLLVGKYSYSCVLVPPASNLKSSTLTLLKKFIAAGGTVIFTGAIPSMVDGKKMELVLPGSKVTTSIDQTVEMAIGFFPNRIMVKDILTGANAASIYVHSRKVGNSIRHLLVNTDEKRAVRARIKMPISTKVQGMRAAAVMDMAVVDLYDGQIYRLKAKEGTFDVIFAPAGSLLIIGGEEAGKAVKDSPLFLGSGVSFKSFSKALPAVLIENFDCNVLEENTLLLNEYLLELDGKQVYEGPVCGAWHKYFYPAPNGTIFRATYSFYSDCDLPGCFAAIEVAENLVSLTFNGEPVKPLKAPGELGRLDPEKSWKDINFTKVPLPVVKKGKNVLVIEGKKVNNITGPGWHERVPDWKNHRATEAEEVYICGQFLVRHLSEGLFGLAPFEKPRSKNLTPEGFPFYCGRAILKTSFQLAQKPRGKIYLGLNGVEMACARIKVNGRECGTLRWPPFILEITDFAKEGKNTLEIEAATTLVNAFGPNRRAGIKEETGVGPDSFIKMEKFKEGYELFNFALESAAIYYILD